jgi:hypothetical protein
LHNGQSDQKKVSQQFWSSVKYFGKCSQKLNLCVAVDTKLFTLFEEMFSFVLVKMLQPLIDYKDKLRGTQ